MAERDVTDGGSNGSNSDTGSNASIGLTEVNRTTCQTNPKLPTNGQNSNLKVPTTIPWSSMLNTPVIEQPPRLMVSLYTAQTTSWMEYFGKPIKPIETVTNVLQHQLLYDDSLSLSSSSLSFSTISTMSSISLFENQKRGPYKQKTHFMFCCGSSAKDADNIYIYDRNTTCIESQNLETKVNDKNMTTPVSIYATTQNIERPRFLSTTYTNIDDVIVKPPRSFISTIHHDVKTAEKSAADVAKEVEDVKLEEAMAKPSIIYGDSDSDLSLSFVEEEEQRKSKSASQRFASWLSRVFA